MRDDMAGRAMTAATAEVARRSRASVALPIVFGVFALLGLLVRIPSIAEPLGVDQCFWASSARALARGQMLYVDVWDHKPPATTLVYFAAFSIFGWRPAAIAWADILASAVTALLLFVIVRRSSGTAMASLASCLYAVFTVPSWLYRHDGLSERAVAETFIVVIVSVAFWLATRLARPGDETARAREALTPVPWLPTFGIGVCIGAAVVFKPNAGVYILGLLAWVVLTTRTAWSSFLRLVALTAIGVLVVPVLTLGWLWSRGALPQAWVALVDFNRMYVSQGLSLGTYTLDFSKAVWLRMKTEPLWLAGGIGVLATIWELVRFRRLEPVCVLAIAWGAAATVAIVGNGARLFNTYFIQALAPLSVLAAWLFAGAARRSMVGRLAASAAAVLIVVVLVQRHYPAKVYGAARAGIDALSGHVAHDVFLDEFGGYGNSRGYSARANEELAGYIRAHTRREDAIYLFGINGAGIYFAADRPTAHRFLRVNFYVLGDFPDPGFHLDTVARELAAARPAYLIFERLHSPAVLSDATATLRDRPPVVELLRSYRFDTQIEDFALYRRVN